MRKQKKLSQLLIGYRHAMAAWYTNQANAQKSRRVNALESACNRHISRLLNQGRARQLMLRAMYVTGHLKASR